MFSIKEKICTFAFGSAFILTERKQNYRDVAQLVAYYVRDVGVASSNLVIPTLYIIKRCLKINQAPFFILIAKLQASFSALLDMIFHGWQPQE